jgi:Domain of unknown function (DUF4174)
MIKSISSICILFLLIPVLSMSQAVEKGSVLDLDLDALRWKNRILVLFSPTESDPSFRLQKKDLASSAEGVLERDLMILEILEHGESRAGNLLLSEKSVQDIRARLGVGSGPFQVFLIGKDGAEKLRSTEPVAVKDIFGLIDSMPMRRQEMDSKKKYRP